EFYEENGYYIYGLRVPESDKIIKKYTKEFKELSFKERLTLSEKFYYSKCSGQTNFGLKLLEMSLNQLKPENFEFLDKIVDSFFIWGPTDSFSLYIMQPLLKKCPEKTKQLLKKWNNSSHIWKKRASVVTFTRKLGEEGKYVDFLLELTDNLIWDEEDLVRKGIGWALKDNMKGKNKEKVLNYVKNLRKMGVSSVITLYAIRKLKGKEREEVLKIKPSK
ncbi:MAG: DNA alkylation repair protein, partial [Candidatus Lokiarchaeota archaeon]